MARQIIIIGGGVIGLSIAAECARRGHRVTVIERDSAQRQGCSSGNAGMIVPSHFVPLAAPGMVTLGLKWMWNPRSPFYIKPRLNRDLFSWAWRFWRACTPAHVARSAPLLRDLNLASREAYIKAAEAGGDFGLVAKGLLMLCKTPVALDEEAHLAERARELGIPAQVLDAKQTAQLEPGVTMEIAGAVYFPTDCHLQPDRYRAFLERSIVAGGGEIRVDASVIGWRWEGSRLAAVNTSRGEISGDEFVLAAGSWSADLARDLHLRIPLQAGKGYSVTLPNPVQMPRICSIFTEARVAVTPMGNTLRFGGTMEIAGLNERVNRKRVEGIVNAISRYYPRFDPSQFKDIKPWCGLRPCSPDGLPYLGRTAAAANLLIATGHAMMGMSLAPITGQIAARLLNNEPPGFDIALLSPDRYA